MSCTPLFTGRFSDAKFAYKFVVGRYASVVVFTLHTYNGAERTDFVSLKYEEMVALMEHAFDKEAFTLTLPNGRTLRLETRDNDLTIIQHKKNRLFGIRRELRIDLQLVPCLQEVVAIAMNCNDIINIKDTDEKKRLSLRVSKLVVMFYLENGRRKFDAFMDDAMFEDKDVNIDQIPLTETIDTIQLDEVADGLEHVLTVLNLEDVGFLAQEDPFAECMRDAPSEVVDSKYATIVSLLINEINA